MDAYKDHIKSMRKPDCNKNKIFIEEYNSKYWQYQSNKFLDIMDKLKINAGKIKVIYSDIPILGYNKSKDEIYIDKRFLNILIFSYKIGYYKGIVALMNHEIGHKKDYLRSNCTSEVSAEFNSIQELGRHSEDGLSQQLSISMFAYAKRSITSAISECDKRILFYGFKEHFGDEITNEIASKAILYYKLLVKYYYTNKNSNGNKSK